MNFQNRLTIILLMCVLSATAFGSDLSTFVDPDVIELEREYDRRLRGVPETLIVFDEDEIRDIGAVNVGEVLEQVLGIHLTRRIFGNSGITQLRGISSGLLILHNGVRLERTLPELLALPVADIRRLEVMKGSHYSLYGQDAIAGTVNIVTFTPDEQRTSFGVGAGTHGTKQIWARKSKQRDGIGYSAFVYGFGTDGSDLVVERDFQSVIDDDLGTNATLAPSNGNFSREIKAARLTFDIGDNWSITQYINHREAGLGVGLLQAIDLQGKELLTRYSTDIRYQDNFSWGRLSTSFVYNRVGASYEDTRLLPQGTLGGLFPDGVIQSYGNTGEEITLFGLLETKLGDHKLSFGFGYIGGATEVDFDQRNYTVENATPVPVPVGNVEDFSDSFPLFAKEWTGGITNLMFRDEYPISEDLFLDFGMRVDYDNAFGLLYSPRVNFFWSPGIYTKLLFSYGESGVIPSTIQLTSTGIFSPLGNPDLKPVKMRMLETSLLHEFSQNFDSSVTAFALSQSNNIDGVDSEDSPNGQAFVNISTAETGFGIEIQNNWQINSLVGLSFGFALQTNDSVDTGSRTSPAFTPHFTVSGATNNGLRYRLSTISVFGRERGIGDLRSEIKDYTVFNATLSKPLKKLSGDLRLSIRNLLESEAREDISRQLPSDLPILPRAINLDFVLRFD